MRKSRFTEQQIIGFLKQAESGLPVKEVCRQGGFSEPTFYKWRTKYGGMEADEARRLKDLEVENARLKKLLAEAHLDLEALEVGFGATRVRHQNADFAFLVKPLPCESTTYAHFCGSFVVATA